jgi:hypothetical protein
MFIKVQRATDAKTWPVEDMIRARSREQGAVSKEQGARSKEQGAGGGEGDQ